MQMNGSDMLKYSSPGYIQASLLSRRQVIDAAPARSGSCYGAASQDAVGLRRSPTAADDYDEGDAL